MKYFSIHDKIKRADRMGEIGSINRLFCKSLKHKSSVSLSNKTLTLLDKANVYTWMAYTLYDDVYDDGETIKITYANILARKAYFTYLSAGVPNDLADRYFSMVDGANNMEIKIRNQTNIDPVKLGLITYQKSIAHCLGQVWILSVTEGKISANSTKGFEKYCAARQLSDDIFDWRADITSGQQTIATYTILKAANIKPKDSYSIKDMEKLNLAFWSTSLESLCEINIKYAEDAINLLSNVLAKDSAYIEFFIKPILLSSQSSLEAHRLSKKKVEQQVQAILSN